jgi:hypothetical protein
MWIGRIRRVSGGYGENLGRSCGLSQDITNGECGNPGEFEGEIGAAVAVDVGLQQAVGKA